MSRPYAAMMLTLAFACGPLPPDDSPRWVRVARDANYTIYLDTGRLSVREVRRFVGPVYDVWYRTDHAQMRLHPKSGDGFTREVVHSAIDCVGLTFRVVSVDMSMGSGRVVVRQRLTEKEVANQKWRPVALGTAEELAARAACHFAIVRP